MIMISLYLSYYTTDRARRQPKLWKRKVRRTSRKRAQGLLCGFQCATVNQKQLRTFVVHPLADGFPIQSVHIAKG